MRFLILILLAGGLGYYVWSSYGRPGDPSEAHAAPQAGEERPGRMLSVADMEAALAEEGELEGPSEPAPAGFGAPPADLAARPAEPSAASAPESGDDLPLDWNLGDPVVEGALLLHDVERVPQYLDGDGRALSEGRKTLLFGYALLIRGLREHAEVRRQKVVEASDVTAAERDLFVALLDGGRPRPLEAGAARSSPLLLGLRMALLEREAAEMLRAQRFAEAAETLSSLLLAEIDAPWPADRATLRRWSEELAAAQARHRWDRQGEWPSFEVEVLRGDSLVAIRKRVLEARPDLAICTGLLARANQIGKYLQPGTIRIPTEPVRVIVDLSAFHLFYLHGDEVVAAWEVAIGRDGKTTPGAYTVGEKLENPPWFQPGRAPVAFGDPENPLGTRWIAWEGSDSLGFHGTWEPQTVGSAASEGCIRMRNEHVEELFEILPVGARIEVRP